MGVTLVLAIIFVCSLIGTVLHARVAAPAPAPRFSVTFWLFVATLISSVLLIVNRIEPFLGT